MSSRDALKQKIAELQQNAECVRNISVIAHVDHGKTTLSDSIVSEGNVLAAKKVGTECIMDTMAEEKEKGITIKSTSISLPVRVVREKKSLKPIEKGDNILPGEDEFLINLIDCPGHVDFSSEVTAALRVTDGSLVVVDAVEGVCVQTKTVMQQALQERIRPILFMNKLDRVFLEQEMNEEEAYQSLARTVESVNAVIATFQDVEATGDLTVYPEAGTVGFGSALYGWGFTLEHFAKLFHAQFNLPPKKMMKKMWGDWFWDKKSKVWTKEQHSKSGRKRERGFVMLVLKPLKKMLDSLHSVDSESLPTVEAMCSKLGITLSRDSLESVLSDNGYRKTFMREVMGAWLPVGKTVVAMIAKKLPSPLEAQKIRVDVLYSGPLDDEAATAIRACDPNGPLMMYVSKMVPTNDLSRFYAFGRVFSGTVQPGQVVRVQGPDYIPGEKHDLHTKRVNQLAVMMGPRTSGSGPVSCGNVVSLVGIDDCILKTATVTSLSTAHNFFTMKYSVSPVVRVAVLMAQTAHLSRFQQALSKLSKTDPLVVCGTDPSTGENFIAGSGELHVEICLSVLRSFLPQGADLRVSQPVVTFAETIQSSSDGTICLGKSPNKLNRFVLKCEPLDISLVDDITSGRFDTTRDSKTLSRSLIDEYKFDSNEAKKIWSFGPSQSPANLIIDGTKGVQYLNECRDAIVAEFTRFCLSGVLADECVRGVKITVVDAKCHPESKHRGPGQVYPAIRKALYACQLSSSPSLLQPIYLVDVTVPRTEVSGVYTVLNKRGASIQGQEDFSEHMASVKAHLPVRTSFGVVGELRGATHGYAFPQLSLSHWGPVSGDVMEEDSESRQVWVDIRKRKGMKDTFPLLSDYNDRL